MSGATASRQRRPKRVVAKDKRKKAPPPAATTKPAVPPARAKPQQPTERQKPDGRKAKVRSAPPPVDLEVDPDVLEFIKAIDDYRARHDRPFPSWSEVLYVLKGLGYRKR